MTARASAAGEQAAAAPTKGRDGRDAESESGGSQSSNRDEITLHAVTTVQPKPRVGGEEHGRGAHCKHHDHLAIASCGKHDDAITTTSGTNPPSTSWPAVA